MKNKEKIILVGGGGQCKASIDVIELQNKYEIAGIVDTSDRIGQHILNYPILFTDTDLPKLSKEYKNFHITVGQIKSADLRIKLFEILRSLNVTLPTIISPLSYVSKHASVDEGTIIMHHALINAGVHIGKNCIINSKALLEHDCVVGNFCHISTGSILNGEVTVGDKSFIGSNTVVKQGICIPINSFVKAGTLVK